MAIQGRKGRIGRPIVRGLLDSMPKYIKFSLENICRIGRNVQLFHHWYSLPVNFTDQENARMLSTEYSSTATLMFNLFLFNFYLQMRQVYCFYTFISKYLLQLHFSLTFCWWIMLIIGSSLRTKWWNLSHNMLSVSFIRHIEQFLFSV